MDNLIGIIEIGSTNTKTHIYKARESVYESSKTIEFKKNYSNQNKINSEDLNMLYSVIEDALNHTNNIHLFGCSIFRNLSDEELEEINNTMDIKYGIKINVISQKDEAILTALGCYGNIDFDENICVFIGGGGSTELVFVKNKQIIDQIHFDFGVVDITKKYPTLKNDIPNCSFEEVQEYIQSLIGEINFKSDILILAGGDHNYWYNNAGYSLLENNLYNSINQKFIITDIMNNNYDRDALVTSLNKIRENSDNPLWFDGSRAMKVTTNTIANAINAKYIVPTKINMEEGLLEKLLNI